MYSWAGVYVWTISRIGIAESQVETHSCFKQCRMAFQGYHTTSQSLRGIAVPFLHFMGNTYIVRLLNVDDLGGYFGFNVYSLIVNELEHLFRTLRNINVVSSVKLLFVFLPTCPLSCSSFSYEFIGLFICIHIHSCH